MLARTLEPELMDDPDEAEAYDEMDHSEVNRKFIEDFRAAGPVGARVLDLGTGPGCIAIELCEQDEDCEVLASDAAVSMLEVAKIKVAVAGFEHRIQLHHGDAKQFEFDDDVFDAVISNSLLHHIPEPQLVMQHMVRVTKSGGRLFVRDLLRPASAEVVEQLVSEHAGEETEGNQQLLRQSLHAALTLEEFRGFVEQLGLPGDSVQQTSDRHLTWSAVVT